MKAHIVSLIHAVALIGLGGYGYLSSDTPSVTALIPVVFGVLLLAMNNGVKKENKVIAHIAVLLTLLIIIGLIKPLTGAMGRGDSAAVARVATMLVLGVLAMVSFVRSFIAARKARG
ncbi:MAG: hypothetical protein VXZ56_05120 [Bacteroidota bacterium]|jgi:uncharacterized membrane protein|nr:hypothetical protein [Flavobacteriales bacterium]MEC7476828.1 hypothetical protein [Bacteroidota bacterium]MEC8368978.1 hypothetical protein [Bacteroidota bacterium]HBS19734.1 hypothetical protein [Flavobacteriales bacterium]HCL45719.1 hypothetical protein [Flavobacteriales bacterium]|tara:strand:+ start:1601 stop:1951 length:351 start_codon:yes stop_codon:yes gene_type:complete